MTGWNNKTILITGAGSGIGLATVKHALANGARVSALIRTPNAALEELESDTLLISQGDVRQPEDMARFLERTISRFETIDVVINNAGTMYYMDITKPDYEQMKTMIETNCMGFVNLVHEVLPALMQSKSGHWINITSDAGKRPFPGLAIYSGSKAFVEFSANAMRQELIEHNIKVTNIQPGNVHTPLHTKSTQTEAVSQYGTKNAGQYLSTTDVVQAIDYALSTPFQVGVNEILIEPISESI